jgi:hypothetical protein
VVLAVLVFMEMAWAGRDGPDPLDEAVFAAPVTAAAAAATPPLPSLFRI